MKKAIAVCIILTCVAAVLLTCLAAVVVFGDAPPGDTVAPSKVLLFVWISAGIILICSLLAVLVSGRIVRRITDSDEPYAELTPLLDRIDAQRSHIRQSESVIVEKEHGLNTIISNMQEGLLLLDSRGIIMSMNKSAKTLLETGNGDFIGKHAFVANPHPMFQAAVYSALGGESCEEMLDVSGRAVQILANPVFAGDVAVRGAVIFVFDVTVKQAAEQMRREFSANVSHELKTPLTSILGYAEIMKDGLVKPEDMIRFSNNIYREARRLIELIEDIIQLSRLDENRIDEEKTEVNLHSSAIRVAEQVASAAEYYAVELSVTGEDAAVQGNPKLIDEMIRNLCDNAIKYNRPGGMVEVIVENTREGPMVSVIDNGIGIPVEHQPRIFERFYRVDKSHSKRTGGTGLGLSIVKYCAIYHGADVELESTPGSGTAIKVLFREKQ